MACHSCELNFLSRSDGSALYTLGSTVVLASVNGPGDVKVISRHHTHANIDVFYSPRTGQSMITERTLEAVIGRTVEQVILTNLHPRTNICINVQEMQTDGENLSASINATCLALLDAGIQMKSTFAAVTCCVSSNGVTILEPSESELMESKCTLTFVFDGNDFSVLTTHQDGSVELDVFSECMKTCQKASKDVINFYRNVIEKSYLNYT